MPPVPLPYPGWKAVSWRCEGTRAAARHTEARQWPITDQRSHSACVCQNALLVVTAVNGKRRWCVPELCRFKMFITKQGMQRCPQNRKTNLPPPPHQPPELAHKQFFVLLPAKILPSLPSLPPKPSQHRVSISPSPPRYYQPPFTSPSLPPSYQRSSQHRVPNPFPSNPPSNLPFLPCSSLPPARPPSVSNNNFCVLYVCLR